MATNLHGFIRGLDKLIEDKAISGYQLQWLCSISTVRVNMLLAAGCREITSRESTVVFNSSFGASHKHLVEIRLLGHGPKPEGSSYVLCSPKLLLCGNKPAQHLLRGEWVKYFLQWGNSMDHKFSLASVLQCGSSLRRTVERRNLVATWVEVEEKRLLVVITLF